MHFLRFFSFLCIFILKKIVYCFFLYLEIKLNIISLNHKLGSSAQKETDPQGIMSPFQAVSRLRYSFTQLQ